MKEVVKVSISGIAFNFDADAYRVMSEYLDRLEAGYAQNPDGKEIVADIEARIAELLLSEQNEQEAVTATQAARIVEQLGFPDDIPSTEPPLGRLPRRLYRNPDGARLGGVCSGLGTFFGVDPAWVRLALFAPLVLTALCGAVGLGWAASLMGTSFGMVVLLYFVLWFTVPPARTPRQKLEMRGEKITASSIRDTLANEALAEATPEKKRSASVWAEFTYVLGKVLLFGVKAIALLVAFSMAIAAVALLVSFCVVLGGGMAVSDALLPFAAFQGITPALYAALVILAVLLPVAILGWLLVRALFKLRGGRTAASVMAAMWLIIVVYLGVMTVRNADNFDFDCWNEVPSTQWNCYDDDWTIE